MNTGRQTENDQGKLWNGAGGRGWVETEQLLDELLKPFEDALVASVSVCVSGGRVLDVGCGTGGTTIAVARLLGSSGSCTGIDISEVMIAAAQARAGRERSPATFICANAQVYPFEPGSFDAIISRFGVMFFEDSTKAFANLRRAATEDAKLRLIAWRSAEENPFMTAAERAAAPLLPQLPPRQPDAPGQFAFADGQRVCAILEESGWAGIDIQPVDVACTLPEKELITYLTQLGPVGRILQHADDRTRAQVIETVRPAFDPYVHGQEVRFTAASWMVSAQARLT